MSDRFIFVAGIQLVLSVALTFPIALSERKPQPQWTARATSGDQQPTDRPPPPNRQFGTANTQNGTSPKATDQEKQPMQEATAWIQAVSAAVTVALTIWLALLGSQRMGSR
jgi:hypothetical protein